MIVEWWWDDGYVGRRPKHTCEIPDEDLEGLSDAARDRVINEYVRQEFENRVTYGWKIEDGK